MTRALLAISLSLSALSSSGCFVAEALSPECSISEASGTFVAFRECTNSLLPVEPDLILLVQATAEEEGAPSESFELYVPQPVFAGRQWSAALSTNLLTDAPFGYADLAVLEVRDNFEGEDKPRVVRFGIDAFADTVADGEGRLLGELSAEVLE